MAKRKRLALPDPAQTAPPRDSRPAAPMGLAPIAAEAAQASHAAVAAEMADALQRARDEGRMVLSLPLDAVVADYLVRDRTVLHADELEALQGSIAARGQQTPIEVVALQDGRYGLISGLRRLTVLRRLHADDSEGGFGTVQALLRQPEDSAEAYLAMVEENEIRASLSYYERARIAHKAVEQGVFETHKAALLTLYRAASRAKRSKIRSFLVLVEGLEGVLRFPEQIGERLGLQLSAALDEAPRRARHIQVMLDHAAPATPEAERAVLEKALRSSGSGAVDKTVSSKAEMAENGADTMPGLHLTRRGTRLVLEGPGVTAAFEADLRAFLAARAQG